MFLSIDMNLNLNSEWNIEGMLTFTRLEEQHHGAWLGWFRLESPALPSPSSSLWRLSNHSGPQSFISGPKESPVFLVKKQKEALVALKWYRREGGDDARSQFPKSWFQNPNNCFFLGPFCWRSYMGWRANWQAAVSLFQRWESLSLSILWTILLLSIFWAALSLFTF